MIGNIAGFISPLVGNDNFLFLDNTQLRYGTVVDSVLVPHKTGSRYSAHPKVDLVDADDRPSSSRGVLINDEDWIANLNVTKVSIPLLSSKEGGDYLSCPSPPKMVTNYLGVPTSLPGSWVGLVKHIFRKTVISPC